MIILGKKLRVLTAILTFCGVVSSTAQTVSEELRADVRRAAGMHYALAVKELEKVPAPDGKKPYYINHYGGPSPYYLERPEYYDDPFNTLSRADSLGKLTDMGRDVLRKVTLLRSEAHNRTGELTEAGKLQARENVRQIIKLVPEIFSGNCYVDCRSVVDNHCLLTLGEAAVEVSRAHQPLRMNINASQSSQAWMNPQDEMLEDQRSDSLAMVHYAEFTARWAPDDQHLMSTLFNDADYALTVDAAALSRQLFDLAGSTQYTGTADHSQSFNLYDVFSPEEIHRHWMRRNAWAYIRYGGCSLNGGHQPYIQRRPLWNLIHQGDSMLRLDYPVVHLRYTHESVVMSLVCLLELNGYGVHTDCLDSLEALGWADYRIMPLGGSMIMIHYRSDKNDPDPMVRVLLNGSDAQLPIKTDCAPYYHWQDVKRYYLRKLYAYARERAD